MKLLVALLAVVWAIDDGEKIPRDVKDPPAFEHAERVELFGLRDEVVAFQVVVEGPAEGVTVEVEGLPPAVRVERFVEHFFEVKRSSTGGQAWSLGWSEGSGPRGTDFTGWLPDALIPVELAPSWSPWPMRVAAGQRGVVWIDVSLPPELAAAAYHGRVVVRAGAQTLATLPLELEVLPPTLPARPVKTMLYYDRGALGRRIGNAEAAERQLTELFRRHRVTALHSVGSVDDVRDLDGDDIVVLGTYGTFGDPSPEKLATVEKIADALAGRHLFDQADVVLYAEDEDCRSPRGAGWKSLIASSKNANARRVRVAWTCSEDPATQPVDVPIVIAGEYRPPSRAWIYNGSRPATGTMLTDTEAVSMRTYGWIAAMAAIPRWFIWETTFWYDGNPGGRGPYDPFVSAETFQNRDGEASMGDGVLVYPGRQVDRFVEHSLGFDGVVPSIRLKNLRRGIEDAGYLELARGSHRPEAEQIARALFPRILQEAPEGSPPSWSEHGKPFLEARRSLAKLISAGAGADPGPSTVAGGGTRRHRPRLRARYLAGAALLLAAAVAVVLLRKKRRV